MLDAYSPIINKWTITTEEEILDPDRRKIILEEEADLLILTIQVV